MASDSSLSSYATRRFRLAGQALTETDSVPWFLPLDRLKEEAAARGNALISYANYDYLGISDHADIRAAAHAALDDIGVGALGSRLVGGERRIHAAFETQMADFLGSESCLALVSGYLTNLTTISSLMGRLDLVIYDELSHNSIVSGVMACRCEHKMFLHNDMDNLRAILRESRGTYRNCLIVAESLYSMDGDIVNLPELVALKEEFGCWLMVDEAHSIGVLGKTGRGICEHYGIDPRRVDIIVGTLSKTFVTCGGFLCVQKPVRDMLQYLLPGFVYSVGLPPVIAASAKAALNLLKTEPQRVATLQKNGRRFLQAARAAGLATGAATGDAIVPVLFASMQMTMEASAYLLQRGVYAPPIVSIGVPKDLPRIRFFFSARHSDADLDYTVAVLKEFVDANPGARPAVAV